MIKDKTLMSIIMNCHNGQKYIKESLNSIKKQTFKPKSLKYSAIAVATLAPFARRRAA